MPPFEFLSAGLNFLPSGEGVHAHSVAGVRWQGLVPEKDTKATLSLVALPPSHLLRSLVSSVLPFFLSISKVLRHQKIRQNFLMILG